VGFGPEEEEAAMSTGVVKWYNSQRGFGFITAEEGGDVFVHRSNVLGDGPQSLEDGQPVEFQLGEGPKGAEALSVRAVGPAPAPTRLRPEDRPFSSPHREGGQRSARRPRN
jgi:CspA family cold shock protein